MAGAYGIFLRGVWDDEGEAQQRQRLLDLASVCGDVVFYDVVGPSIVRVQGGAKPAIVPAEAAVASAIRETARTLGADQYGWIDTSVRFEDLEPFRDHGAIMVPGLVRGAPGTAPWFVDDDHSLGSIEDMEAGILETIAEAEESPDEYEDQQDYLDALRRYLDALSVCKQHRLILHC
jgi:hypothetical protein